MATVLNDRRTLPIWMHRGAVCAIALLAVTLGGCLSVTVHETSEGVTTKPVMLATSQDAEATPIASNIRQHYIKQEVMVPMRDGVRLHTAIYRPKDESRDHPILIRRTPYSCRPYGPAEFPSMQRYERFLQDGYVLVFQDVRGCYMSQGEFINMRPHNPNKLSATDVDEASDTWDTVEWLINNVPANNGHVGMWGISYPGFYAAAGMIDAHPALKAVSPQAPIADWWFDDFHHHGAFFLPHSFGFLSSFGLPRPEPTTTRQRRDWQYGTQDGYQFYMDMGPLSNANDKYLKNRVKFWNEVVDHPNYDEFWQSRDILPHLHNVSPAVMTVGGWFDAEDLYGPLNIYQETEKNNPNVNNIIVMGPWAHGGWSRGEGDRLGNAHFGQSTSPFYQSEIEKVFFDHYLLQQRTDRVNLPEAHMFETGANRWRQFDAWPPRSARDDVIYAHANGGLSFNQPRRTSSGNEAHVSYISDPSRPVPFCQDIGLGMTRKYMTDDQRFASRRPDVAVFQTDVLTEDLTLAGPIIADMWVSTSGSASDWVVKIIDVFPGDAEDIPEIQAGVRSSGYQMMVRSEVIRGRFRESYEHPKPFTPDEPTRVKLPLQDVLHTFKKGHRLMIHIQSSWFPLVDRNPQKYVDNIFKAKESDFITTTQKVYCSPQHPTRLRVGILED